MYKIAAAAAVYARVVTVVAYREGQVWPWCRVFTLKTPDPLIESPASRTQSHGKRHDTRC